MTSAAAARPRRELLLEAAADLFAAHGFHDVGIDDIGAAAGITGPGVYRHFASKAALLEALCDSAMTRMLQGARATRAAHADPLEALRALVDLHVDFAVASGPLIAVWARETRALSPEVRRSLRRRQRAYEEPWRQVVTPLRPDLSASEVTAAVRLVLTMLNGSALVAGELAGDELAPLMSRLALAALLPSAPGQPLSAHDQ